MSNLNSQRLGVGDRHGAWVLPPAFPTAPKGSSFEGETLGCRKWEKKLNSQNCALGVEPPTQPPITWAPMTPGLGSQVSSASWTPLPGVLGPYNSHPTPPALRLGLNAR